MASFGLPAIKRNWCFAITWQVPGGKIPPGTVRHYPFQLAVANSNKSWVFCRAYTSINTTRLTATPKRIIPEILTRTAVFVVIFIVFFFRHPKYWNSIPRSSSQRDSNQQSSILLSSSDNLCFWISFIHGLVLDVALDNAINVHPDVQPPTATSVDRPWLPCHFRRLLGSQSNQGVPSQVRGLRGHWRTS